MPRRMFVALAALAALGWTALAASEPAERPRAGSQAAPRRATPSDDAAVMARLQLVFGTSGPLPNASPVADPPGRGGRYREFLRQQMSQDAFYDNVLPKLFMLIDKPPDADAARFTLQQATIGGKPTYFIDEKCAASDVVSVRPWWDLASTVRICKRAYRPEVTVENVVGGRPTFCEAPEPYTATTDSKCGCGAFLVNCVRDEAQAQALQRAYREEIVRTLQYVIQAKRPYSDVLVANGTVRSDLGDFFYARARYFQTGRFEFPTPSASARPRLRPRPPEFVGLMTAPQYRLWNSAPRLLVSVDWDEFLCTTHNSSRVDAHTLMATVSNPTLRLQEHMELTTQAGCRDCHTRLEYGMRVFRNFPTVRYGLRYYEPPGATPEATKFYVNNSSDLRAEGPATPQWLGEVMSKQPELYGCMVQKMEQAFYADEPVPATVHDRLVRAFAASQDVGKLVEDVVVARFVGEAALTSAP